MVKWKFMCKVEGSGVGDHLGTVTSVAVKLRGTWGYSRGGKSRLKPDRDIRTLYWLCVCVCTGRTKTTLLYTAATTLSVVEESRCVIGKIWEKIESKTATLWIFFFVPLFSYIIILYDVIIRRSIRIGEHERFFMRACKF